MYKSIHIHIIWPKLPWIWNFQNFLKLKYRKKKYQSISITSEISSPTIFFSFISYFFFFFCFLKIINVWKSVKAHNTENKGNFHFISIFFFFFFFYPLLLNNVAPPFFEIKWLSFIIKLLIGISGEKCTKETENWENNCLNNPTMSWG